MPDTPFSSRHVYVRPVPIRPQARNEVTSAFRSLVVKSAKRWDIPRIVLRELTWGILKEDIGLDDKYLWPAFNIRLRDAPWYRVYDFIEGIYAIATQSDSEVEQMPMLMGDVYPKAPGFAQDVNEYLVENGIPWQLVEGAIVSRGDEAFETAVGTAHAELTESGRPTAAGRIHEALHDLSRRPEADYAGAISHAINALECVAGDIAGNDTGTLGDLLKVPDFFPSSLRKTVEGVWAYANNEGARHGKEGKEPAREEAELIVGLTASIATYLNRKAK